MATDPTATPAATTVTADCGDPATQIDSKPEATKLCMFAAPATPADAFARTSEYAKDPKAYLIKELGQATFDERKHLLCIPEVVDKDAYGTGQQKAHFEEHIAKVFGKKSGLFFLTGVQAQLAALKIHCERAKNPRIAWHVSCHLESAEERAYEELYHLQRTLLGSDPDALPTVDEIKEVINAPKSERPAVVVLEIPNRTLGCATYTFDELREISAACKAANVVLHCDGARIWEIEPYYRTTAGKTFADIAALFDTFYTSFYKGLQGASGAMLMANDESIITDAKVWQRRAGGNAFTLSYELIDCERGFNTNIGTFARKRDKMVEVVESIKSATRKYQVSGHSIVNFVPGDATCCQIRTRFDGFAEQALLAARDKVADKTSVRVFERAFPSITLDEKMAKNRAGISDEEISESMKDNKRHMIEWMMMSITEKIETKVFVDGYVALCEELMAGSKD